MIPTLTTEIARIDAPQAATERARGFGGFEQSGHGLQGVRAGVEESVPKNIAVGL